MEKPEDAIREMVKNAAAECDLYVREFDGYVFIGIRKEESLLIRLPPDDAKSFAENILECVQKIRKEALSKCQS